MEKILRGTFFLKITDVVPFFSGGSHAQPPLSPKFALFVLLVGAWGDDLIAVLFEFLDDDAKLAQSCTDWLDVQHWYIVVPDPAMRVTLWALMGAGENCHEYIQDTPLHLFLFLLKRNA